MVHGRDEARASAVNAEIRSEGGTAAYVLGDLSSEAAALEVFREAERQFGSVDILVNNPGSYSERAWFDTTARLGTPAEVAALVAFVASPRADYITGANLRIDGGKSPSIN